MSVTEEDPAAAFHDAVGRYRRELMAHCYQMTGSAHDAEDLVQETYLRAWRGYASFEGRSSVRTWLHRIATNVCLTSLEGRARRPLPTGLGTPDALPGDDLVEDLEIPWLEPVPDVEVAVTERDSVRLAFIAALQHLPPRQRAILILRDVLRWTAKETAEALGTTAAAVNSALQRAHAQIASAAPTEDTVQTALDERQRHMLDAYVDAFWRKDVAAIVDLLTRDAVWEMPPYTGWYVGRERVGELIDSRCPGGAHEMPMVPTSANGQPAFGLYMAVGDGTYRPFHLQVLTLSGDRVAHVVAFFDTDLFARFGLPEVLTGDDLAPGGRLLDQPGW